MKRPRLTRLTRLLGLAILLTSPTTANAEPLRFTSVRVGGVEGVGGRA